MVEIYIGNPYHSTRLVETRLMIELVFEIHVLSMELRRFEKPYVYSKLAENSSNWASYFPSPRPAGAQLNIFLLKTSHSLYDSILHEVRYQSSPNRKRNRRAVQNYF